MTMIFECSFAQRVDVGLAAAPLPRSARPVQGGRYSGPARARVHCIATGFSV